MNRLEEIREIIKNFILEKQQMKQTINKIEHKRMQLAKIRNEKKSNNIDKAYTKEVEAEINELGKEISDLGNESQKTQYELDAKSIYTKNEVNMQIDNQISERIREVRKLTENKEEIEEIIRNNEAKTAKYQVQKQEFYTRFGRMPELSATAQKEVEDNQLKCEKYQAQITIYQEQIQELQNKLSELTILKNNFKNEKLEEIPEQIQEEVVIEEIVEIAEIADKKDDTLEEQIERLVSDIIEEQEENVIETESVVKENEEETVVLPFVEIEEKPDENYELIENLEIEEIRLDDIQPIEEVENIEEDIIKEIEPIKNVQIEETQKTEDIQVEEIVNDEDIIVQEFQFVENIEETEKEEPITNAEEIKEEEIITNNEVKEEVEVNNFTEKVSLINIVAKIEDGEIVYKAETSNKKTIKIKPIGANTENILLKEKENREELKEILINYAIAEYRTLDKKVIKKIDPIICEMLINFAKEYNYDIQNLIYNYAMSFSKMKKLK